MFNNNLSEKEQKNILKIVIITGCLLIIAQCIYMGFFHFPDSSSVLRLSLVVLTLILSSPFIYVIYLICKSWKNK